MQASEAKCSAKRKTEPLSLEIWTEKQEKEAWAGREDRPGSKEGKAAEGRLGKREVCRWGFEEQLLSNRGFASCQLSWSRAGQELSQDEMLGHAQSGVPLLIPPPLRYGALNVPQPVSSVLALPLAHNNPAIQSKRQVYTSSQGALLPSLPFHLLCPPLHLLHTEGSAHAGRHPSLQDKVDCVPLVDETWLHGALF